ncbi:hypothetical protein DFH06DRAFT_1019457 [Mycena polygramma]|nr:hypothetical protein DFH06DRAFT_1019457 [Mycena polygramma]
MFDAHGPRWAPAPSSSPPSSPTAYNDSSPASSPGHDDSVQDEDWRGGGPSGASPPMDPFAAAAKGPWVPPEYEKGVKKNRPSSPSSPTRNRSKKPRLIGPESSLETVVAVPTRVSVSKLESEEEKEAAIWDEASDKMVDNGNGTFVEDLHHWYVPPEQIENMNATRQNLSFAHPQPATRDFSRSITAPAILGSRAVGSARHDIQIFLAGNRISTIPVGLLSVDKLTVLSLRGNRLKILPPEIQHLKNLHTLNVAGNELEYLPAEMLEMKLKLLTIFPNSFKENLVRSAHRVPPLVELALRSLFLTDPREVDAERRIARYYVLPLCEADVIPPHLRRILHAIHPGSVDTEGPADDDPPSLGSCPGPHHLHESVFVTPAEERFTWETVVAGVDIGGEVCVKWRGCLWGCLDFLDVETPVEVAEMDVDEEQDVATRIELASGGFGVTDFEDEG